MKHQYLTLINILSSFFVYTNLMCQTDFNNYQNVKSQGEIPPDFHFKTYEKIDNETAKGRNDISKHKKDEFLKNIHYSIDDILHSGLVVYGDPMSNYVNEIANILLAENPNLKKSLRFYILNTNQVNAFSADQGIVFVTTGILSKIKNEAQLAFILAHEISHYTERHVVKTFNWNVKNEKRDDNIRQLSIYAKEKEIEADSLAVKLCYKAGYSSDEILSTFDMLLYSELPFSNEEFPIDYWNDEIAYIPPKLFKKEVVKIEIDENLDDKLSSHPNIRKRKDAIINHIAKYSNWGNNKNYVSVEKFMEIQKIARFESIRNDVLKADYIKCLYSVFLLEKENPKSTYLAKIKALAWLEIMKNPYSLDIPDVLTGGYEGEIDRLRSFLTTINSSELNTLGFRQIYMIHQAFNNDPHIQFIYEKSIEYLKMPGSFDLKDYSTTSIYELQKDSGELNNNDSTSTTYKTDIDTVLFYKYLLPDIISNSAFLELYNSPIEEVENNSSAENKNLIVVEPTVIHYNQKEINRVKSEKLEEVLIEAMNYSLHELDKVDHTIDRDMFYSGGTDLYNERSVLYSCLYQLSMSIKSNTPIFVDYESLKKLREKYNSSRVMYTLVYYSYDVKVDWFGIALRLEFVPAIPFYILKGFFLANSMRVHTLVLDLKNGSVFLNNTTNISCPVKKWYLRAIMNNLYRSYNI